MAMLLIRGVKNDREDDRPTLLIEETSGFVPGEPCRLQEFPRFGDGTRRLGNVAIDPQFVSRSNERRQWVGPALIGQAIDGLAVDCDRDRSSKGQFLKPRLFPGYGTEIASAEIVEIEKQEIIFEPRTK